MTGYRPHPAAELFPLMKGAEFDALVKDIREHGQLERIVLHDGMVLDGRNRYRACLEAAIAPRFVEWDGEGSTESFIISKNFHRRHLTTSQRSMAGGRLANLKKGRHPANGPIDPFSNEDAAEALNVSPRSVKRARVILDSGDDELIRQVDAGETSVNKAAERLLEHKKQVDDLTPTGRKRWRQPAKSNAARGATMRQYGVLARQLYDGLDAITGLPDIETMLKASNKKREVLTTKVPIAISWLNDFARAQSERNKADDEKRREVERLQGIQEETQSQDGAFDGSGGGQHGKAAASNDDQEPEK